MPSRLTNHFTIVSRRDVPSDVAAPEDLTLDWIGASATPGLPEHALAYCADWTSERVLFTHHAADELDALFAAPFLFVEQLRLARGATAVPFEHLAAPEAVAPPLGPVLVFSPGRTGSTLLVRLLASIGLGCASEPDMLTQIGRLDQQHRQRLPPEMEALLAGTCIGALCRVLGPDAVIKLRSWCNARPLAMVGGAPGCRVVFMLRGMRAWALSRHRVFHEPALAVAAELQRALDAMDMLAGAGIAFEVLWFETLAADPAAALRLFAPEHRADATCLAGVLDVDSQAGSWIARSVVAERPVQADFMAEFVTTWTTRRAGAVWSARTEALLARMWDVSA